jgi:hypothetical protein
MSPVDAPPAPHYTLARLIEYHMSPPTSPVVEVIAASKLYGRVEALHAGVARPSPSDFPEFNSFLFAHAASPDER